MGIIENFKDVLKLADAANNLDLYTKLAELQNAVLGLQDENRELKDQVSSLEGLLSTAGGRLWLRAILALAYTFGFRRGELLGNPKRGTEPLRCKQVDLLNNTICLYAGETKNGEPRIVAKGKQAEDYLFTRTNGEPVRDFREVWETLTAKAGGRACCSTTSGARPCAT